MRQEPISLRSLVTRLLALTLLGLLTGIACRERIPPAAVRGQVVYPVRVKGEPNIRVLVADHLGRLTLSVSGAYHLTVTTLEGRKRVGGGDFAVSVAIAPGKRGLRVGRDLVKDAVVEPLPGNAVEISYHDPDGRSRNVTYAKPVILARGGDDRNGDPGWVRVIVTLGLEEYIAGVVGAEMYPNWPLPALKAQAVVSRTFALYKIKTRGGLGWDVRATVHDQVWKPLVRPHPRVLMAVNATRGLVMLDDNRLFPAFFHAQCAGYTDNAKGVFLSREIKALWGVRCPDCSRPEAKLKHWRLVIGKRDLSNRLRRLLKGEVRHLRLLDARGQRLRTMGRVRSVEAVMQNGLVYSLPLNASFRPAVGADAGNLASTYFNVVESPDRQSFIFEGMGAGHGVGMCQYGARYMAAGQHATFADILARYYTGSRLVRLW